MIDALSISVVTCSYQKGKCRTRPEGSSRTLHGTRVLIFPFAFILCGAGQGAAIYVNPSHPQAQDRGQGHESRAYRTISQALENLRGGERLVIMEGVYRETVDLKQARLDGDGKRTIIEGAPGAKVVIKGSDVVTGWEPHPNGVFVKRNWPHNSQQVFVDGVALRQIGGTIDAAFRHPDVNVWLGRVAGDENSMAVGDFHYDAPARNLYITPADRTLTGKTVEVSVRPYLVYGTGLTDVTLRNLTMQHANTSAVGRAGAVVMFGNGLTLAKLSVTWNDSLGINLTGNNNTLINSVSNYNGQTGIVARGRNVKLIDNDTSYNNTRGFNQFWEAGGIKCMGFGGLVDSVIVRHKALFNKGGGIWLDTDNRNVVIRNSEVAYNDGDGIHYEISYAGTIVGNYAFGNRLRGIYLSNAAATVVEHNLVIANDLDGIAVNNERSSDPKYAAVNNKIIGNIMAWNGKTELRLPPKNIPNISNENLFVGAQGPMFGVWDKPFYPRVSGLSNWIEMSGQDKNSWQKLMPFPPALETKIKRRETDLDWPMLTSIARQLDIAAAAKRPGPPN